MERQPINIDLPLPAPKERGASGLYVASILTQWRDAHSEINKADRGRIMVLVIQRLADTRAVLTLENLDIAYQELHGPRTER